MKFVSKSSFLLLAILILAGITFSNSLLNAFLWDDIPLLVNNGAYLSLDFIRFFTTPANGMEYLPVRDLTYAMDYAIWGMKPFGFHLTNLVLYLLNIIAVYFLSKDASMYLFGFSDERDSWDPKYIGLLSALFFGLMPLHSEVVCFVTSRNTLLSGLFTFLSCDMYIKYIIGRREKRNHFLCLSFILFILAILSKATSLFLPLFLITLLFFRREQDKLRQLTLTIPYIFATGAAYFLFTTIAKNHGLISEVFSNSISARIAEAVQIPYFYLGKFLVPLEMSPDYATAFDVNLTSPTVLCATIGLIASITLAIYFRREQPLLLFSLCWFISSLVPVLHLMPTSTIVADRYAYLPSFAFCYFLAVIGFKYYRNFRRFRYGFAAAAIVIIMAWSLLTVSQNKIWQSEKSLWEHTLEVNSNSFKAVSSLAWAYFMERDYSQAAIYFDKVHIIKPDDPAYAFFQGMLAFEDNDFNTAIRWFNDAQKRGKYISVAPLYYIAQAYEKAGNKTLALESYEKILNSAALDAHQFREIALKRMMTLSRN